MTEIVRTHTKGDNAERLLTVVEAAERLAVSPRTVRNWIYQGRLDAVRLGRAVRLRDRDISMIVQVGFLGLIEALWEGDKEDRP